jgi:uncharacterized ferritin-like protein (DUF455 family)
MSERARRLLAALTESSPEGKVAAVADLRAQWASIDAGGFHAEAVDAVDEPGRPSRPALVAPRELRSRGVGSKEGRAVLIHAITHIEFNAINLALDAMHRFRGMPEGYYQDWLQVAVDEAKHFALLQARLAALGYSYGDFPAAWSTRKRCLQRMALVPRVLEARGLDVTPGMMDRLQRAGDAETVAVLNIILRDEVAHVAAGTRWFVFLCEKQGLEAQGTFLSLIREHASGMIREPFNDEARTRAGFDKSELQGLRDISRAKSSA